MKSGRHGIPLVAIIIFFVLIIGIIITCLIILGTQPKKDNQQLNLSSTSNNSQTETKTEPPVQEEVGEEISLTDENLINLYKLTGKGNTPAKYAIYKSNSFTTENIDNDLKLKLALAQVKDFEQTSTNDVKTITKTIVDQYLTDIFGTSDGVTYNDITLFDDNNFANYYKLQGYKMNMELESYELTENDIEQKEPPEVSEIVTKALQYSDKIEIYVSPIFVNTYFEQAYNSMAYQLYSGYDFSNKQFSDLLIAVLSSDYHNVFSTSDETDIDGYIYEKMAEFLDMSKLKNYKYTFTKNGDSYVLSGFEEVIENNDGQNETESDDQGNTTDDTENQTDDQNVESFNSKINSYLGDSQSAQSLNELIDIIISINSQDENEKKIDVDIGTNVLSSTDALTSVKNVIEDSKTYKVEGTKDDEGYIIKVTISENQ